MNQSELEASFKNHNQLQLLRGFYYAALYKSYEKAADRMFVGQYSIIMQIQALEADFGVKLIVQKAGGVELTDEGEIFYRLTAQIVNNIDHLRKEFETEIGLKSEQKITIAATGGLTLYLLSKAVQEFRKVNPNTDLRILNKPASDVVDMVSAGEVDLGIAAPFRLTPVITYEECFTCDTILLTPQDHPLTGKETISLEDIASYPLILIDKRYAVRHRIDQIFHENNLLYDCVMECGAWEIIIEYVKIGLGISIVPGFCTFSSEDKVRYTPVSQHFGYRNYGMLYRKGKALSRSIKSFMDILNTIGSDCHK